MQQRKISSLQDLQMSLPPPNMYQRRLLGQLHRNQKIDNRQLQLLISSGYVVSVGDKLQIAPGAQRYLPKVKTKPSEPPPGMENYGSRKETNRPKDRR